MFTLLLFIVITIGIGIATETFGLVDEVSAASITLSVPSNLSLNIIPKTGETFNKSATQHLSVQTDASRGYLLSIANADNSNSNNLVNGEHILKSIENVDGITEEEYLASGNLNTWGFLPSILNSVGNNKYIPGPNNNEPIVLDKTNVPNEEANNYDITLASKVDDTLPIGEYNNKFTFTAVADDIEGVIFKVGENIEMIKVSDSSNLYKSSYAFEGKDAIFENLPKDTKLIVTVVPKAGYKLASWTRDTHDGTLNSEELLTTTYVSGGNTETLTANGIAGTYTPMQELSNTQCLAAPTGLNVTDTRNNVSYTVANVDGYCYMLSNLRLEEGTQMTVDNSDVSKNIVLPYNKAQSQYYNAHDWIEDSWVTICNEFTNNGENKGCSEYSYDGLAANNTLYAINTAEYSDPWVTSEKFGTVCPKGWTLPSYKDILSPETLWDNGSNPAMLTFGEYASPQMDLDWDEYYTGFYYVNFNGDKASYEYIPQSNWELYHDTSFSVRCRAYTHKVTFKAGSDIEVVKVASKKENFISHYAFANQSTSIDGDLKSGDKIIVTVIPKAGSKLASWTRDTNAGTLSSEELLTTNYTVGNNDETLIANGTSGTYTSMQDFSNCTTAGANVTDQRDSKSYTVAKIGSQCFMLSNLRLAANTHLTSDDSDVTSDFTLPGNSNPYQGSYSIAKMIECLGNMNCANGAGISEYYYNWYAAMANPNDIDESNGTTKEENNKSLGSICPKGWKLPSYTSSDAKSLWASGDNPAMLMYSGNLNKNYINNKYNYYSNTGGFWSTSEYSYVLAYILRLSSSTSTASKYEGISVRCAQ